MCCTYSVSCVPCLTEPSRGEEDRKSFGSHESYVGIVGSVDARRSHFLLRWLPGFVCVPESPPSSDFTAASFKSENSSNSSDQHFGEKEEG